MKTKKIKIEIEVPSDTDNERIENYLTYWLKDNFYEWKKAKITIEDGEWKE